MGRALKVTVLVPSPPELGGEGYATFGPGDDVPDWAAEHIGDHCYADDATADADETPADVTTTKKG